MGGNVWDQEVVGGEVGSEGHEVPFAVGREGSVEKEECARGGGI